MLFADIAGFTARFDRADPEDISAALRPFHARLKQEIESFGGTVDKFAGDVVFGVFGAPIAHEDDAERAIRAALKIRDWVHEQSEADAAQTLGIRIGIATGEAMVAVGQGPRVGERVTGDIVNTASRLQSTAAPDSIVVGESTYLATETPVPVDRTGSGEREGQGRAGPHLGADRAVRPGGGGASRRRRGALHRAARGAGGPARARSRRCCATGDPGWCRSSARRAWASRA